MEAYGEMVTNGYKMTDSAEKAPKVVKAQVIEIRKQ
jgi:hypothetical protein